MQQKIEIKCKPSIDYWRLDAFLDKQTSGYCNLHREEGNSFFIADLIVTEDRQIVALGWKKVLG